MLQSAAQLLWLGIFFYSVSPIGDIAFYQLLISSNTMWGYNLDLALEHIRIYSPLAVELNEVSPRIFNKDEYSLIFINLKPYLLQYLYSYFRTSQYLLILIYCRMCTLVQMQRPKEQQYLLAKIQKTLHQ